MAFDFCDSTICEIKGRHIHAPKFDSRANTAQLIGSIGLLALLLSFRKKGK